LGRGPTEYANIPPKSLRRIEVFGKIAVWALVLALLLVLGAIWTLGGNGTHNSVAQFVVPDELNLSAVTGGKYLARLELLLTRCYLEWHYS
jgi:hypothetical protein